ncbi:MAG TPA: FAD-linked oxidase C-terminal domain-containing protein [Chloroflexota bacterium]|nr:FAD-linked oxidase C-terminal domain-containing protein [Chloroflexota bacterium]
MTLAETLRAALGPASLYSGVEDVIMYEYDYGLDRGMPDLVALPRSTAEVQAIVRAAQAAGVPIVARGAGTGISGGAVPAQGGLVISMARFNQVLEIDEANRCAVVQPGVVNLDLSKLAEPYGLFFAPDPSSQKASTIGGNVANNAGGPHCLSLGVTVNHILGVQIVLHDGSGVRLGGKSPDGPGLDLTGLIVGSEGTLGVVTEVTVRLLPLPEAVRTTLAVFTSVEDASEAVSNLIGRGLVPAALEMMDRLALSAIEAAFHAGYPPEAGAVLLVEVDGLLEQVEAQASVVDEVCRSAGALEIRLAATPEARAKLWAARKGAASAMGRIAPNYYLHDAVVPRTKLPQILAHVVEIGQRYDLPIANLFHAGDGNLHPMILFDAREPGILVRVMAAGNEILNRCIDAGGTITGEHGVGLEKINFMPLIFSAADLEVMGRVRSAVEPSGRFNPGKVLPSLASGHGLPQRGAMPALVPEGLWV